MGSIDEKQHTQSGRDNNGNCLCKNCIDSREYYEIEESRDFGKLCAFMKRILNDYAHVQFDLWGMQYDKERESELTSGETSDEPGDASKSIDALCKRPEFTGIANE